MGRSRKKRKRGTWPAPAFGQVIYYDGPRYSVPRIVAVDLEKLYITFDRPLVPDKESGDT